MKGHWPLGRGRHLRSVVHTLLASGLALLPLSFAALVLATEPRAPEPELTASCRVWSFVMFAVLSLQGASLWLFKPAVLALLLPTPYDEKAIYKALDPMRSYFVRGIPYVFGVLAVLPRGQELGVFWTLASMFYACMLMDLLLPFLVWLAVLLRKLLVPWGHCMAWVAAAGTVGGLIAEEPVPVLDAVFLRDVEPRWVWLVAGALFIPLARLARWWSARASLRHFLRDELVDYAFPTEGERRSRRRRMLVEMVGGWPRIRRFVFLVQESFGLYRPVDWVKGGLVWLVVFLIVLLFAGQVGGSPAHMLVTYAATFSFVGWSFLRLIRLKAPTLRPLGAYAPPVGHVSLLLPQLFLLSVTFFATGVLAALAVWLVVGGEVERGGSIVRVCVVNLGQGGLAALALWAGFFPFERRMGNLRKFVNSLLLMVIMYLVFFSAMPSLATSDAWAVSLPRVLQSFSLIVAALWVGQAGSPDAFMLERLRQPLTLSWVFEAQAWALPAVVLAYFLLYRLRIGRGRAHPGYRALLRRQGGAFLGLITLRAARKRQG